MRTESDGNLLPGFMFMFVYHVAKDQSEKNLLHDHWLKIPKYKLWLLKDTTISLIKLIIST